MQTPEDEKFEMYLKQFRPVHPDPLPTRGTRHLSGHLLRIGTWGVAVAAVLIVGATTLQLGRSRVAPSAGTNLTSIEQQLPTEPLTVRNSSVWLARAPSLKVAVDALVFRPQANSIQQGKQSAVDVLGKENTKL